ncbi:ATP-binding protein [Streptomyces sp. AN091965]|uniref:ATP-binding protein n=1 Tax=Streptomyces sp. AN091965 TaxID=2927803 RepID=UPI001F623EEA|nr:ATP-binding protein [Streptomyces sp. AN091965]MCI3933162.1 ATP-binding protein [Streptomyces sp. AN091965]
MTNPTELPPPPSAQLTHAWSTSYPMTPAAAALARKGARRRLAAWQWRGDADDAVLVVSELVANAARHGRVTGHHLWLRLAVTANGGLLVDVSDPVTDFPGFDGGAPAAPQGEGGRGLLVVRQLAQKVGWFPRPGQGKTVRALLPPTR